MYYFAIRALLFQQGPRKASTVDRPSPVTLHDAMSKCGRCGLVEPAARLLHQDVGTGLEAHVAQVLPDEPHHLKHYRLIVSDPSKISRTEAVRSLHK